MLRMPWFTFEIWREKKMPTLPGVFWRKIFSWWVQPRKKHLHQDRKKGIFQQIFGLSNPSRILALFQLYSDPSYNFFKRRVKNARRSGIQTINHRGNIEFTLNLRLSKWPWHVLLRDIFPAPTWLELPSRWFRTNRWESWNNWSTKLNTQTKDFANQVRKWVRQRICCSKVQG